MKDGGPEVGTDIVLRTSSFVGIQGFDEQATKKYVDQLIKYISYSMFVGSGCRSL